MKRILIADDHPVVRLGLHSILSRDPRFHVVGEAADPGQLEEWLANAPCDLVITDLSMPWGRRPDGVRMLAGLRRDYPELPLLVVTTFGNEEVLRAVLKLGVSGILEKTSGLPALIEAVDAALRGGCYLPPELAHRLRRREKCGARLTARESEVVRLLAHGLGVKEIADVHRRTVSTISRQKGTAMKRLGLTSDFELMVYARAVGLSPSGG
ncbi:LuxR family two component transcriptional regulator [Stenotrophomonas rhizophila]|uniref:response regulator transcription factor n=1 Tax=Stenotrophomonas rhizophila TaxID=216778 RepID=UPI000F4B3C59|nr:response regulator transcription factor [Stenotrophomonas rhizophila]ROP80339.1 LuxR family two component transcriptional regulator [Stenotrophomonas rhizophila]